LSIVWTDSGASERTPPGCPVIGGLVADCKAVKSTPVNSFVKLIETADGLKRYCFDAMLTTIA
jgi:hypothetical protein